MRAEIVSRVRTQLEASGVFAKVCGLGFEQKTPGPLCRVWWQGAPNNLDDKPAYVQYMLIIQIETTLDRNASGDTDETGLYALIDQVFNALHQHHIGGAGSQPITVADGPGLRSFDQETGRVVYAMQASIRVMPASFNL